MSIFDVKTRSIEIDCPICGEHYTVTIPDIDPGDDQEIIRAALSIHNDIEHPLIIEEVDDEQ